MITYAISITTASPINGVISLAPQRLPLIDHPLSAERAVDHALISSHRCFDTMLIVCILRVSLIVSIILPNDHLRSISV